MDNKASLKGAWLCHVTRFILWGPRPYLRKAESRAVKFCTKGDYINSCQRDNNSPLKGAWFCSRDQFLYAQLSTSKIFPTALQNCDQQCRRRQTTAYRTYTVFEAILRLKHKLHRFDLSLYLLQSWLYNI